MKKAGTKQKLSTTFHPQINGQIEKMNGILNQYLHNYIINDHKDWGDHLSLVDFCYKSTKMSPFELALRAKAVDLTTPKTRGAICREGDKEAKKMAKEHEKRKAQAIKIFKKM